MGEENAFRRRVSLLILTAMLVLWGLAMQSHAVRAQDPTPTPPAAGEASPQATPEAPEISHTLVGRSNCLICHKDGFRDASIIPSDHKEYTNEECRDCHAPGMFPTLDAIIGSLDWEAIPEPLQHPAPEEGDSCVECHQSLGDEHEVVSQQWENSVHGKAGVSCSDCHGGDPRTDEMNASMSVEAGFLGVPPRALIPRICGGCHSDVERMRQYNLPTDQYTKYMNSVHGERLKSEGDANVALCVDCHGSHDVQSAADPSSPVYPLNVPELCAGCHSDADRMKPYGIPTGQFEVYKESVHGKAVLEDQNLRAANCVSCHGSHAAKPPTSEEVINVCGKCHSATLNYYEESLHSRLQREGPQCWTCHGTHDVSKPGEHLFLFDEGEDPPEPPCGSCHINEQEYRIDRTLFSDPKVRRCATCHHPGSMIGTQVEALRESLLEAAHAFEEAEQTIQQAKARGMIVTDAETKLTEARTDLIRARAALHTTKLPAVTELTDAATASAEEANKSAADRLAENVTRRMAMIVAIGAIAVNVVILSYYRRRLYQTLE